jgi:hypothetical protein
MASGTPVTYTVTGITQETQFTAASNPIAGKRVTYQTSTGYEGTVFVPDSVFGDAGAVRQIIEGEVRKVAVAQSLSGTVNGT